MAGTTTNFAIPYPSSTDYVTDGATAMKSLADQVDAAMFTGSSSGNLLINGAMQVTQRSAVGTAVTGLTLGGYLTADRWYTSLNTLGTWSETTNNDAPTGSGFRNSFKLACTTANASPAAGAVLRIAQPIEGQNLQSIRKGTASAQTLTLSFWVASFQTGTFICELVDNDNSRSVSKAYTVNASNTWEYKTITFPADTTGVFDNDANESLSVNWWVGAGSTYTSGTLQTTWGTLTSANRAVGQTNGASSTSNRWNMTGAQLTVGSVATPFQFNSYADDLRACQRYYYRIKAEAISQFLSLSGQCYSTTGAIVYRNYPVTMRMTPTALEQSGTAADYKLLSASGSGINCTSVPAFNSASTAQAVIDCTVASGLVAGNSTVLASTSTNAYLAWSAEL